MTLETGAYATRNVKDVVVWRAPDADGDDKEQWVERVDGQGRSLGRVRETDNEGRYIKSYLPPDGFENRPGYDHSDNYVKVDDHGRIERQPNGEAIIIRPGQALVFHADGSVETLEDEYAQYTFFNSHDQVEYVDEDEE